MAETTVQKLRGVNSSFTPFLAETARIQELKNVYLDLMMIADLAERDDRDTVIRTGKNMLAETTRLMMESPDELRQMNRIMESIEEIHKQLLTVRDYTLVQQFGSEAYVFITELNNVMQRHGQGFKLLQGATDLDKLAMSMQADVVRRHPKYGFYYHYDMDIHTDFMASRIRKNLDNFWCFEGKEGYGKSTTAIEYAILLAEKNGVQFDLNKCMFNNQKKEYVYDVIRKDSKRGEVYIFDEAVNQTNKKQWWRTSQVELMALFTLIRSRGLSCFFCIPAASELDLVLRDKRLHGINSLPERGQLIVKVPNLNPESQTYSIEKRGKGEVVSSPEALTDFLNAFDRNKILQYPVFEIPEDSALWKQYSNVKEASVHGRKMQLYNKPKSNKPLKEQMLVVMLTGLDPATATLNKKQVDNYGVRVGYKISFDQVVKYLAKNTGLTPTDIIRVPTDSTNVQEDAYADLTEAHIKVFLDHLRNMDREIKTGVEVVAK